MHFEFVPKCASNNFMNFLSLVKLEWCLFVEGYCNSNKKGKDIDVDDNDYDYDDDDDDNGHDNHNN